jgi:phage-related protein
MREVVFYRNDSGGCPVADFLDALTGKQAQKIAWVLRLIEEIDVVPAQYFRKLSNTNDIWEVRIEFKGDTFRLLGFFDGTRFLVLTQGFQKKTQKTPAAEIRLSEQRRKEYLKKAK